MRLRKALPLALALALLPAASASAQADFTGTLSAEAPKFEWDSSASGAPDLTSIVTTPRLRCSGGAFHCEHVLLDVKAAGVLSLALQSTEGAEGPAYGGSPLISYQDVDGFLYKSDATGTPQGDTLTNPEDDEPEGTDSDCVTSYPSEECKLPVEPGFYVLEVEYYLALEAPIHGIAELIGAAPSAAQPPAAQPPAGQPPAGQPPAGQPPAPQQPPASGDRKEPGLRVAVSPSRDRKAPFRFRTTGELLPPAGVSREDACKGRVSVQVKRGKSTISTRRANITPDCRFASAVKFSNRKRLRKAKSLKFTVRFLGNKFLAPVKADPRMVRVR